MRGGELQPLGIVKFRENIFFTQYKNQFSVTWFINWIKLLIFIVLT